MATLFTIGHGTRTTAELVAALEKAGIGLLIDVRRFPGSKRHPHFAREQLEADLPSSGMAYEWWGEELGGRRRTSDHSRHPAWRNPSFRAYADHMESEVFRMAFVRLEGITKEQDLAFMCAETLWWRCHRRLIADLLVMRGHTVLHIIGEDEMQTHEPNPSSRPDGEGWIVYDVGVTPPLGI